MIKDRKKLSVFLKTLAFIKEMIADPLSESGLKSEMNRNAARQSGIIMDRHVMNNGGIKDIVIESVNGTFKISILCENGEFMIYDKDGLEKLDTGQLLYIAMSIIKYIEKEGVKTKDEKHKFKYVTEL